MFKLSKDPQFTHPVTVMVPKDGGGHDEQVLKTRFRVRAVDDLNQHNLGTPEGTEEFLRAIVVRFEDVVDDAGQQIPSDDALTTDLLALSYVRIAITQGYFAAVNKAKAGN